METVGKGMGHLGEVGDKLVPFAADPPRSCPSVFAFRVGLTACAADPQPCLFR